MSTASFSSLNPSDLLSALKSDFKLKLHVGVATVNTEEVSAVYYAHERPAGLTAVSGLEIVVAQDSSDHVTPLLDGREIRQRRMTLFVASYSTEEALHEFEDSFKEVYGLENVISTHLHDPDAFATAIGGVDIGGVVSSHQITFVVPAKKYVGVKGEMLDAPVDGQSYVRKDGAWVLNDGHHGGNIDDAAGYFFQNSHYFSGGLSHENNPDVQSDVEAGVDAILKFTDETEGESGNYLQTDHQDHDHEGQSQLDHFYDRATGVITLHHTEAAEFVLVRIAVDIEPDSDNSAADIVLRCTANGESGGFSFDIEEQLVSLDQGADLNYPAVASIPVFIGDTLKEAPMGQPATITPIVRLRNTSGDIKPRSLAFFIWS